MCPHDDRAAIVAEDDSFPTVEEIIPRREKTRFDFSKLPEDDPEVSESPMREAALIEFRARFKISAHINLIPAGHGVVQNTTLGIAPSMPTPSMWVIISLFFPWPKISAAIIEYARPNFPYISTSLFA